MARYGLEPIPDPAVDAALRDALSKLKGRPLIGVIGSLGVRRDAKAVEPLSGLLKDKDADVAQAAARALGSIGTPAAVQALEDALAERPPPISSRIAEGLFRCAEALSARDRAREASPSTSGWIDAKLPQQVRDAAARKARFLGQEAGPTL